MNKEEKLKAIRIEEAKIRASQRKIRELKNSLVEARRNLQEKLLLNIKKEIEDYIKDDLEADDFTDFREDFKENVYDYCQAIVSEIVDSEDAETYESALRYAIWFFKLKTLNGKLLPKSKY